MSPRDPRRGHPDHEPTDPPPAPKVPGVPGMNLPPKALYEPGPLPGITWAAAWHAAKRWTPAGVGAVFLIIFFALGGKEGVVALTKGLVDAFSGASALKTEIASMRTELAKTNELLRAQQQERQSELVRISTVEHNLRLVCDLASEMNVGKPHPSWCSADGLSIRFEPPPVNGTRFPVHVTAAPWKQPPVN